MAVKKKKKKKAVKRKKKVAQVDCPKHGLKRATVVGSDTYCGACVSKALRHLGGPLDLV